MEISVIGLGKLGAVMAAVIADAGYVVKGVDQNPETVALVNSGLAPVQEPGLDALIAAGRDRLSATTDTELAVLNSDATFIIVPTPSGPGGAFRLDYVLSAIEAIGRALRRKESYHLVVLSSTVMPGSTGSQVLQHLERVSGKRCGPDFGLCYNPEFIALGSVIRDMRNPDMVLIGESDERAGEALAAIHRRILGESAPIARMNFVNAELTKLSVNTFVTTKISYANMLAEVCERLDGADVDVVTAALGMDSRIGRKYLKGALGYGGPCFPRDNVAFSALARQLGATAVLAEATHAVNRAQVNRLAALIGSLLPEGGTVGILGLSYKPMTGVVEESQGVALAQRLSSDGVNVAVFDPLALDNARALLPSGVHFCGSVGECARRSHLVILTTAWPEFRSLRPDDLNTELGRPAVIDCWRILPRAEFEEAADYVTLGCGVARRAASEVVGAD